MKNLLCILLWILLGVLDIYGASFGQSVAVQGAAAIRPAAGGSDIPAGTLYNIDFEEAGAPTGIASDGTVNYDATDVTLQGSQCLKLDGTIGNCDIYSSTAYAAQTQAQMFFEFQFSANPGSQTVIATLETAGYSIQAGVYINSSGQVFVEPSGGSASANVQLTAGVHYYIWWDYVRSTSSDGTARLFVSTSAAKPGSPDASSTNGTSTSSVERFELLAVSSADLVAWFDNVRLDPKP